MVFLDSSSSDHQQLLSSKNPFLIFALLSITFTLFPSFFHFLFQTFHSVNNNSPRHQNKKKRHRKRQRIVQGEMSQFVDSASKKSLDDILKDNPEWYEESEKYWATQKPDENDMLGGLKVDGIDIVTSKKFLSKFFSPIQKRKREDGLMNLRAVDCGAGIGRISFKLLLNFFPNVDLVEPNKDFLQTAKMTAVQKNVKERCDFICTPLQGASFPEDHYHVVWIQWVIGYLTDEDLVKFFQMAKRSLKSDGLIILKDNVSSSPGDFIYDDQDKSLSRSLEHFQTLFKKCDLTIVQMERIQGFPKDLLPIYCFALR